MAALAGVVVKAETDFPAARSRGQRLVAHFAGDRAVRAQQGEVALLMLVQSELRGAESGRRVACGAIRSVLRGSQLAPVHVIMAIGAAPET